MPSPNVAGLIYALLVKSLVLAKGDVSGAIAHNEGRGGPYAGMVTTSLKSLLTPLGTDDLPRATPAEYDFAALVRSRSVLGRLVGLRRVPARTRLISATSGSTAFWAGERQPRPISKMVLAGETLEPLAVTAMLVSTLELLQSAAPAADLILANDLAAACVAALDLAFLNYLDAGEAGVRPAGIGFGTTPLVSTGAGLAETDNDLAAMITALSAAGSDLSSAIWITAPRSALHLSRLRGSGGALAHPAMGVNGGVLLGLPCLASTATPLEVGSPQNGIAVHLLDPSQIVAVDNAGGSVEVALQASLQMESEPGSDAVEMVSLFQTYSAALKLTRYANWRPVRPGMVQVLAGAEY